MKTILFVALGGALGSVARYLLSKWLQAAAATAFPLATLAVNVAGCLLRLELQNDSFISYQSGQAHFHFDAPVSWTLDGEYGGDWQDVDIQIHQQAIRMIIPEK